jgi:hypothetical protein
MSDEERMDMGGDDVEYEGYDPDEIKWAVLGHFVDMRC